MTSYLSNKTFSVTLTVDGKEYRVNGQVTPKGRVLVEEAGEVTLRTEDDEFCTWLAGDVQAAFLKKHGADIRAMAKVSA